jgi:non-ribosomal peptide synthetase component F
MFSRRFASQFYKYPDNIAVQYGGRKFSYRELDKRSKSILNWLYENDIPKETFIGIYIEDRIDFIAAMIGIIKAGCVFVPLDAGLPVKRLENMVRMTQPP